MRVIGDDALAGAPDRGTFSWRKRAQVQEHGFPNATRRTVLPVRKSEIEIRLNKYFGCNRFK